MTTKTTSALARRAELETEQNRLEGRAGAVHARAHDLAQQLDQLDQDSTSEQVKAAREDRDPELAGPAAKRAELETERAAAAESARTLQLAADGVPDEIARLHRDRWEEFRDDAEQATRGAMKAWQSLERAYTEAADAWAAAAQTWATVTGDLDPREDRRGMADLPLDVSLMRVPGFPLPAPHDAFSAVDPPRPTGLLPAGAHKQGKPGNYRDATATARYFGPTGRHLDTGGVRTYEALIRPDARGFAPLHRDDDES